jgi:hypothetical protein
MIGGNSILIVISGSLATIFFGGFGLITKYAYKSKCSRVELCCIKIERDIEVEEREDIEEMKHPRSSAP